ncbi:thioesterase domain-containing protein, partial [Candidatus Bathyarchaeota archaeon]|nr:thioesterase domain-containing protein [Candidatus Bathyarchaeota archaeon]
IDEVILNHPSVLQAVTFAFPHRKLGEDVAVAVVLRDKSAATEWEIQKFVASRLAEFKVPSRVIILDAMPKGPTGKVQRIGLAEKLGLALFIGVEPDSRPEYRAPSTPLEEELVRMWSEVLKLDRVGVNDNFFQLGGDSIQAGLIISKISRTLQVERIPLAIFLHAPTIRTMCDILSRKELDLPPASLTAIQRSGSRPAFYCIHACEGEVLFLTSFAKYLGPEQPFYALRAQGLDGYTPSYTRVEDMAAHYLKEIQAIQPEGPYLLGGAGVGGIIAWEMAQRLKQQSKEVSILVLMDSILPKAVSPQEYVGLEYFLRRVRFHIENGNVLRIVKERKRARIRRIKTDPNALRVFSLTQKAADSYIPAAYDGRVLLFMSEKRFGFPRDPKARIDPWHKYAVGRFNKHVVPGEHMYIFKEPNVQVLARMLRKYLDEIQEKKI